MEFTKVGDWFGEDGDTVEITDPYSGYIAQLKSVESGEFFLSWHQENWICKNPKSNSHVGSLKLQTDWVKTREEAITEGILLLTRFLIEGLEQLGADDQMSLVDLKQEY